MLIMSIQDFSMYAIVWLKIKQRISYQMIGILSDWALLASYYLYQVCMNHMNVMIKISPISAIVIISNILCRMVSQIFYISWDIEPHSKKKTKHYCCQKNHSSVKSAFHMFHVRNDHIIVHNVTHTCIVHILVFIMLKFKLVDTRIMTLNLLIQWLKRIPRSWLERVLFPHLSRVEEF